MTYTITKHIKIEHEEDGWSFDFTTDECGTVSIEDGNGPGFQTIHIPKDCIQHFIDVLEQYKWLTLTSQNLRTALNVVQIWLINSFHKNTGKTILHPISIVVW